MIFKSNRQRKAVMAKLTKGEIRKAHAFAGKLERHEEIEEPYALATYITKKGKGSEDKTTYQERYKRDYPEFQKRMRESRLEDIRKRMRERKKEVKANEFG